MKHRTWFKVILNPILRMFGWSIVSCFENDKLVKYKIKPYPEYCSIIK
jgi:hypothetical protein